MAKFRSMPKPSAIMDYLNHYVHGQERAKRELSAAAYRHYLGQAYGELCDDKKKHPFGPRHILVLGPTGAGKTHLVRTLAEGLGVPIAFADAASLVESGYVGEHLSDVFRRLLLVTRGDVESAHHGIVFIDEIDKIRRQESNSRDVAGEGVQASLLAPLDGSRVEISFGNRICSLDTGRLLFICTGAFVGLTDIIRRRVDAGRSFGFRALGSGAVELNDDQLLARGELADLREYGFIPEFLGRFAVITTVGSLSRDDMIQLLKNTENSPLRRHARWFATHGVELIIPDETLGMIADQALAIGTNARGLDRALTRMLAPFEWQLPELNKRCVRQIILTPEVVRGKKEPLIGFSTRSEEAMDQDLAMRLRLHAARMLHPDPDDKDALETVGVTTVATPKAISRKSRRRRRDADAHGQAFLPFAEAQKSERGSTNSG